MANVYVGPLLIQVLKPFVGSGAGHGRAFNCAFIGGTFESLFNDPLLAFRLAFAARLERAPDPFTPMLEFNLPHAAAEIDAGDTGSP